MYPPAAPATGSPPPIYEATLHRLQPPPQRSFHSPAQHHSLRHKPHPITRLPTEILIAIFTQVNPGVPPQTQPDEPRRLIFPYWVALAAVCLHWRDIVNTTGLFWNNIDVGRQVEWLGLCLRRSSGAPLTISFRDPAIDYARATMILEPHKDRVYELYRHATGSSADWLLPYSMNKVEMFCFNIKRTPGTHTVSTFPVVTLPYASGYYPQLRMLVLYGLGVRGPSACWEKLRLLAVSGCSAAHTTPYSISAFLDVLQSCVGLEALLLLDALAGSAADVGPERFVSLPNVKSVYIHGLAENVSYLISHMEIPLHAHVSLSASVSNLEERVVHSLFNLIPHDPRVRDRALPILRSLSRVKIETDRESLGPKVIGISDQNRSRITFAAGFKHNYREVPPLFVGDSWFFTPSILANLPRIIPGGPQLYALVLFGTLNALGIDSYHTAISAYPGLRLLIMDDCEHGGDARALFEALRGVAPEGKTQNALLCPKLEYLWVRNAAITLELTHEIQRCVEWRNAQDAPLKCLRLELHPESGTCLHKQGRDPRLIGTLPDTAQFAERMRGMMPMFHIKIWRQDHEGDRRESFASPDRQMAF